jgi:hypothetical protein
MFVASLRRVPGACRHDDANDEDKDCLCPFQPLPHGANAASFDRPPASLRL